MNILILEDEQRNADRLMRLVREIDPSVNIAGPITNVKDAVTHLKGHFVTDLILADIRLSDGLSFDALKEVGINTPVLFTTAYDVAIIVFVRWLMK